MTETDYQALFEQCTAAADSLQKELALTKLQQIIYFFPVKRFAATWDVAGDFYLFAQNYTEALLDGYQSKRQEVSFQAYLAVKLRSLFLNFLRRRRTARNPGTEPVSWDDELTLLVDSSSEQNQKLILQELRRAIASLDFWEQITLKLHYSLPLSLRDIRDLARARGSYKIIFQAYRTCLLEQKKSRKKFEKELARSEKYLTRLTRRAKRLEQQLRVQDIRQKTMEKLLPFVGHIKMGSISALLGEHQSTTGRRLKAAEAKLRKILARNLGLRLTD